MANRGCKHRNSLNLNFVFADRVSKCGRSARCLEERTILSVPLDLAVRRVSDIDKGAERQTLSIQKVGILPRKSSGVCSLTAALVERNGAQGNTDKHRSMVVVSRA